MASVFPYHKQLGLLSVQLKDVHGIFSVRSDDSMCCTDKKEASFNEPVQALTWILPKCESKIS